MGMNIDQPRHYIEAVCSNDSPGTGSRKVRRDLGNLTGRNSHVHDAVSAVFGIDDMPALQEQIISLRLSRRYQANENYNRPESLHDKKSPPVHRSLSYQKNL